MPNTKEDEKVRKALKMAFKRAWEDLKTRSPRSRMIAKTTRKYVAEYFFVAGARFGLSVGYAEKEEIGRKTRDREIDLEERHLDE